jgi:holo-[acyl-carrier protein] synthase
MIYGVGIDMVEIHRIKSLIKRHESLERIFGSEELLRLNSVESFAASFCAKEAFSKALGTGIRGFGMNEVEVAHDSLGKPYLKLSGKALDIAENLGLCFNLSITHTDEYAAAVVVAERG